MPAGDKKLGLYAALSAVAAFALYAPSIGYQFTYDDHLQILNNPSVLDGGWSAPLVNPTLPGDLYRPLTILSYRLNFLAAGFHPAAYHLLNVLLHSAVTLLVFLLVRPFFASAALSMFAALLFAVHPIHVEAVANIAGRAELLAAFFGLLALAAYRRAVLCGPAGEHIRWSIAGGILLLLAALSKESAVVLLFLAPLYIAARYGLRSAISPNGRRAFAVNALAIAAVLLARRIVLQDAFLLRPDGHTFYAENPLFQLGFAERLLPALQLYGRYLSLLVFPGRLSADYSMGYADFLQATYSLGGLQALLATALFVLLFMRFKACSWSWFAIWYFLTFALTINLFFPIGTLMGERLAYLPSVGFCAFAAGMLESMLQRRPARRTLATGLAVLLLAAYCARAAARLPVWADNQRLFAQTAVDAPRSPKALVNRGIDELNVRRDPGAAEQSFREALLLDPGNVPAMRQLVDLFLARKDLARADFWCRKILAIKPGDSGAAELLEQLKQYKRGPGDGR